MQMQEKQNRIIGEALPRILVENGLDATPVLNAARTGLADTLKVLGDLVERRYGGATDTPSLEVLSQLQGSINESLREIARRIVSRDGAEVAHDAPIHAGGFSWVVKVSYQGKPCALVLPKFTLGDYEEKIAIRAEMGRLLPDSDRYSMPRAVKCFSSPVPCALMTYVTGENCYTRTFDGDRKPHEGGIGPAAGIEVFRKLGELARGFSTVQGERFGAPLKLPYASAGEYIRTHTDKIERELLSNTSLNVEKYGLSLSQLRRVVEWVKRDAESQTTSYLTHGDLSPWNLLHDASAQTWSLVDGDDAKFGVLGEQIGVCLNSMCGNFNRAWIDALMDGYEALGDEQRRHLLIRGAAYGTVTYGLTNVLNPWSQANAETCRATSFLYLTPCLRLFNELVPST